MFVVFQACCVSCLLCFRSVVFQACCVSCLLCFRPVVFQVCCVSCLLCFRPVVFQACCVSGLSCFRPVVFQVRRVSGLLCLLCFRPVVFQACCVSGLLCFMFVVFQACCVSGLLCFRPVVFHVCCVSGLLCFRSVVFQGCCVSGLLCFRSVVFQAAAALCVAVGSFSDPDALPGLAHFLEHMVFMGSEKFPEENGFDSFLKEHGGSDNASTDCERSVFYFDVERRYFREALDRWAQFFICPLMVEDAVEREVEAVDSEFQMARPSDSQRKEMLFGSIAKPGHPMGKFLWGNTQTLKQEPRDKGINTYEHLRQFWTRYYTAQYMTLAVQSRECLDTLEQWVREIFSLIPNNGEPAEDFSHLQEPFDTPDFNKLYRVVPVKKVHALTISWALPPQAQHYRVKPLFYISWLIEHEGAGSILSLLRKKCWALALFAGNNESGFEQNSTFSVFSVSITLTEQGHAHFHQVAHVLFQYLKMLQTLGPQQSPVDFVASVCENMQLFSKEHFLTGDTLLFEYKPQVIGDALALLTPLRANVMLLSPENQGQCDLTEKWFGTSYGVKDVPQEWRDLWSTDFELNPDLHLPAPNRFISEKRTHTHTHTHPYTHTHSHTHSNRTNPFTAFTDTQNSSYFK
uniref:Nardilysin b (N-arginine dibasic convertase) n=1 Tax=Periophthalmus magnuspinnatus TaxID=409849 RepID=A0A3B4A1W4_9GOBI